MQKMWFQLVDWDRDGNKEASSGIVSSIAGYDGALGMTALMLADLDFLEKSYPKNDQDTTVVPPE
jgi:hypothetical protein